MSLDPTSFSPTSLIVPRTIDSLSELATQQFKPWNVPGSIRVTSNQYIAAVGDLHGAFLPLANGLENWNQTNRHHPISLALQAGDAEAMRHSDDIASMLVPDDRYRQPGTFSIFYSQQRLFPVPLWIVGGNHEAHCHNETPAGHAKQLAENIFCGGRLMTLDHNSVKIVGLAGDFDAKLYDKPRPALLPARPGPSGINWEQWAFFNQNDIRAAHTKFLGAHIMVLHDWPAHLLELLDPYTIRGAVNGKTTEAGNEHFFKLLSHIKPDLLVCGHVHQYLSGRIYWHGGKITEVVCLDRFRSNGMTSENVAVVELAPEGMRLIPQGIPLHQTPQISTLLDLMTPADMTFMIALNNNVSEPDLKKRISQHDRRIQWQGNQFFIHDFCFTLERNPAYDPDCADNTQDGSLFKGYYLSGHPTGPAINAIPQVVLAIIKKALDLLKGMKLSPTLIGPLSDFV